MPRNTILSNTLTPYFIFFFWCIDHLDIDPGDELFHFFEHHCSTGATRKDLHEAVVNFFEHYPELAMQFASGMLGRSTKLWMIMPGTYALQVQEEMKLLCGHCQKCVVFTQ